MKSVLIIIMISFILNGCNNRNLYDNSELEEEVDTISFSDNELLNLVQKQTFNFFWEGAEANSGMAQERIHLDEPEVDKDIVTTGGSGFGFMAILVGVERGYISREEALLRFEKIVGFLETADRFHGAWPHWLNGKTGKVIPFSTLDNGGDLVETSFLIQGLLTVSEYFKEGNAAEKDLTTRIDELWKEVEWDWYTKNGEHALYWHWSPNHEWEINFKVTGYNETLIMYVLAASSPTHGIEKEVYQKGWGRNGEIVSSQTYYDLPLILDHNDKFVGPLFWAHYSYLGLDPNKLQDEYVDNYWTLNKNHAEIIYNYCVDNPKNYKGYGEDVWGLTASYSINGYAAHRPSEDIGVISPTAALSSFPYTPEKSMRFLRYLYTKQDSLIGKYGPYDAFSLEHDWYLPRYLAIDQGTIPVMIENYRTQLLWKLFMNNKDVQDGLVKLGFGFTN